MVVHRYQVVVESAPGIRYEKKEGHSRFKNQTELFVGTANLLLIQHLF